MAKEGDVSWLTRLPIVEVSVKVYIVSDVNLADQTFRCCFLLYLEWFDPSIQVRFFSSSFFTFLFVVAVSVGLSVSVCLSLPHFVLLLVCAWHLVRSLELADALVFVYPASLLFFR